MKDLLFIRSTLSTFYWIVGTISLPAGVNIHTCTPGITPNVTMTLYYWPTHILSPLRSNLHVLLIPTSVASARFTAHHAYLPIVHAFSSACALHGAARLPRWPLISPATSLPWTLLSRWPTYVCPFASVSWPSCYFACTTPWRSKLTRGTLLLA